MERILTVLYLAAIVGAAVISVCATIQGTDGLILGSCIGTISFALGKLHEKRTHPPLTPEQSEKLEKVIEKLFAQVWEEE